MLLYLDDSGSLMNGDALVLLLVGLFLVLTFALLDFSNEDTRLSLTIELCDIDWCLLPLFFYILTDYL